MLDADAKIIGFLKFNNDLRKNPQKKIKFLEKIVKISERGPFQVKEK